MFKPPPDPKTFQVLKHRSPTDLKGSKKPKAVLDEDDYVEKVGQIIERDFFPELEKLRRALKGGPGTRAEDKALGSASTAQVDQSPATFETPDLGLNKGPRYSRDRTPAVPDHPQESSLLQASPGRVEEANKVDDADETRKVSSSSSTSMRLDEFMAKHTGEDNESFNELAEESRQVCDRSIRGGGSNYGSPRNGILKFQAFWFRRSSSGATGGCSRRTSSCRSRTSGWSSRCRGTTTTTWMAARG